MSVRLTIASPDGEAVVRDVVDSRWAEPSGDPDSRLGEGLWALPGLVDAHSHLATETLETKPGVYEGALERARDSLAAGVTLLLDKGWSDETTLELIEKVPPAERPEIEAAGRIIAVADGYYPNFANEIDPADMVRHVAEASSRSTGWVKLIGDWPRRGRGAKANFTEDELRTAVETAESSGARVAIHTMARDVPTAAVAAGIHSIEHGLFLTADDIDALAGRGGIWVPTLLRVEVILAMLGAESGGGRLLVEGLANCRRLLPLAVEAGVHVLAGTDLVGRPSNVVAEAVKLGEYGLSAPAALHAISRAAFEATGRPFDFSVGAPADAVFFAVNPLEELGVLSHPQHVMRMGRLVR